MKIKYDKESDIVYIKFSDQEIIESDENKPGVILDYDKDGNIAGIEVLNASSKMGQPNSISYELG